MTTCNRCGTQYGGQRTEHCMACHQTFTNTGSGDKHRVGEHGVTEGPDRRRCLTPDEMREKGMRQNQHSYWTRGDEGRPFPTRPRVAPRSDEQAQTHTQVPPEAEGPQWATRDLPGKPGWTAVTVHGYEIR